MNNPFKFALKLILSIVIILLLFNKIGGSLILETASQTPFLSLLASFILITIFFSLTAISYKLLISNIQPIKFSYLFSDVIKASALSIISPGRIGQLYIIKLFKKHDINTGTGSSIFLANGFLRILTKLLLSIIGLLTIFKTSISAIIAIILFFSCIAAILIILNDFIRKKIISKLSKKLLQKFSGFSNTFKLIFVKNPKTLLMVFLINCLQAFTLACIFYVLFKGYGTNISIVKVFLTHVVVSVVTLIPVSFDGLGIREGAGLVFFSFIGLNKAVIISSFIIVTLVRYFGLVIFLILISITEKNRKMKNLL